MEQGFKFNRFHNTTDLTGLAAYGKKLANLIIMEKGTISGTPEMGIGIGTYKMENLTNTEISTLRDEIQQQINSFIKNPDYIKEILVDKVQNQQTKQFELYVGFEICYKDFDKNSISNKVMVINTKTLKHYFV